MKHLLATILISIGITQITFSQQGPKNFIDQPYIEVIGKAEMEIIPNEIFLQIVLNENDTKGKVSIESQEEQMLAVLKDMGIDIDEHLSVQDYDGYYKRKFLSDNEMIKIKNYELLVCDGKTLSQVYYELDKIDISNISIKKISHSDITNIRREMKLKALKTAKQKAADYAEIIEQTIGNAIFIQESNSSNVAANSIQGLHNIAVGYGTQKLREVDFPSLQLGKITVSETVLTKFILK